MKAAVTGDDFRLNGAAASEHRDELVRRRAVLTDPVCRVGAAVAVTWLVGYALMVFLTRNSPTGSRVVGDGIYLLPVAAAAAFSIGAARHCQGRARRMWLVLSASNLAWFAGELIWSAYAFGRPGGPPFPSPADLLYLMAGALAIPAILLGFGNVGYLRHLRGLLDAALLVLAFGSVGWRFLIAPQITDPPGLGVLTTAAYPLLDLTLLACLAAVGVAGHRTVPYAVLLVGAATACAALSDAALNVIVAGGGDPHNGWLNIGWQAQAVLMCLAALVAIRHPRNSATAEQLDRDLTLVPLLVAAVATFTLVAIDHLNTGAVRPSTLVVSGVMLAGLVVRQFLFVRDRSGLARQLQVALGEQQRAAVTDGLTGLYNRRFLLEMLKLEADRSQRAQRPLSLAVIDLDHFKRVNDTHGHPIGDLVLVEATNRIRKVSRSSDIVARYGGEEFVVLLPDADGEMAHELAERLRHALRRAPVRVPHGYDVAMTASLGVATAQPDPQTGRLDTERLVADADRALYQAKAQGRDRTVVAGRFAADTVPVALALPYSLLWIADRIDATLSAREHSTAVERWSRQVGRRLGLGVDALDRLAAAARLHDIGKATVDEAVLRKVDPLDPHEWEQLRGHCVAGGQLLHEVGRTDLAPLVEAHHERYDGTGYPRGLAGKQIPLEARIIAVCDSYAAMRVDRSYARAKSVTDARHEVEAGRGGQFDPTVADAFLTLLNAGLIDEPQLLRRPALPAVTDELSAVSR